jgi:hypothetical protein
MTVIEPSGLSSEEGRPLTGQAKVALTAKRTALHHALVAEETSPLLALQ